jgi:hypothetical protein
MTPYRPRIASANASPPKANINVIARRSPARFILDPKLIRRILDHSTRKLAHELPSATASVRIS